MTQAEQDVATLRAECDALRTELDETNQGVVALYAELDKQAEQLREASELKSRFLSYMSHEFRTPLGSILSMTRLLDDELDGPLNGEQHTQVRFISTLACVPSNAMRHASPLTDSPCTACAAAP